MVLSQRTLSGLHGRINKQYLSLNKSINTGR